MRLISWFSITDKDSLEFHHKPRKLFSFRKLFFSITLISIVIISWSFYQKIFSLGFLIESKNNLLNKVSFNDDLKLKEIHVIGRNNLKTKLLLDTINVYYGTPILSLDLINIQEKIYNLGWIKNVVVERRLPNTLLVKIEEYEPLALLQKNNDHFVISPSGNIIIRSNGLFNYLPVVKGEDAELHAAKTLNILSSEPSLFHQVWAISFISKRRWDVHLRSGVKIKLPEKNTEEVWSKLAEIDRYNSIISRDIYSIDLRHQEKIIIEPTKKL